MEVWMDCYGSAWQAAAAEADPNQHPAVRMLEQLPANLSRLVFDGSFASEVATQQAATLAAAFSRQPMQLRSVELPGGLCDQAATLLPVLSQLHQLTSLVIWMWLRRDISQLPMQHMPAQLQQLELRGGRFGSSAGLPWSALEHVTGLTSLSMASLDVDAGSVLPRGLRALTVADVKAAAPVLLLGQLTALQLEWCSAPAEQLRQLSTLAHLEQLSVTFLGHTALSNAAGALGTLPLVHLGARSQELTAACLDHLGACSALTQLQLDGCNLVAGSNFEQLAAVLARLTGLAHLKCSFLRTPVAAGDVAWSPVCQALAGLPRLSACDLSGAKLGPAAAAALAAATQLTELDVRGCRLDDASVSALCGGLTGLQRLEVSFNESVSDGCLEAIAALRRLTWLHMQDTGATESGLAQLQVTRPQLQLESDWR